MAIGWILWMVLLAAICLVWLSRHVELNEAQRDQIPLAPDSYDAPPADAPRLSVIIAAKDEEANIETCVRTMLTQDYPNFELIVVNDRSTDRTPEILNAMDAEDDRLHVVHVDRLRDGWFGKNNAMREGIARADGDWLCFADADCRQTSDRTLSMAMRQVTEHRIDFLSVLPVLETHSFWERVIQPVCGAIMVLWFNPKRVNNPKSKAAYANGAFMLMHRKAYKTIGGHEAVRSQVNEDMHMARAAKQRGLRLFVMQNRDLYQTRMYDNLGAIWKGWSRIFYGCFGTYRQLALSFLVLLTLSVLPWASAAATWLLIEAGASEPAWWWIAAIATATVLAQQSVIWRYYRMTGANPWLAPTYVLGAVIGLGILINAVLKVNGRTTTTWRGTTYRGLQREDAAAQPAKALPGASPRVRTAGSASQH